MVLIFADPSQFDQLGYASAGAVLRGVGLKLQKEIEPPLRALVDKMIEIALARSG